MSAVNASVYQVDKRLKRWQ